MSQASGPEGFANRTQWGCILGCLPATVSAGAGALGGLGLTDYFLYNNFQNLYEPIGSRIAIDAGGTAVGLIVGLAVGAAIWAGSTFIGAALDVRADRRAESRRIISSTSKPRRGSN